MPEGNEQPNARLADAPYVTGSFRVVSATPYHQNYHSCYSKVATGILNEQDLPVRGEGEQSFTRGKLHIDAGGSIAHKAA